MMTRKLTFAFFLLRASSRFSTVRAASALRIPKLRAGRRDNVGRGLQEEPTLTSAKAHFAQNEPLRVSFTSGGVDASNWKIGIYLHDADPQEGGLAPMMSLDACENKSNGSVCTEGTVEFSDPVLMEFDYTDRLAVWPLQASLAYDFQLLNEDGWQVVWDVPMFIIDEPSMPEDSVTYANEENTSVDSIGYDDEGNAPGDSVTEPQEESVAKPSEELVVEPQEEPLVSKAATYVYEEAASEELPTITMEKMRFITDEPIGVSFTSGGADASNWRVGIYPRMADPQDGALRPIVSLPACSPEAISPCTKGTVEFRDPNDMEFGDSAFLDGRGGEWPLDPSFGYDVQLLNENGSAMVWPPAMFDFIQEEDEEQL